MRTLLLLLSLVMVSVAFADEEPVMQSGTPEISARTKRMAADFQRQIENGQFRTRSNHALNAVIRLGVYQLRRHGHWKEGNQLLKEWEEQWQFNLVTHGITDHAPLSQWIAQQTMMLQLLLGHELMHASRLDDLITINYSLPIIFGCEDNVNEAEFFLHFVADDGHGYRGLGPVVIFWSSFFTCVGGTWGMGFWFCSPISMGVEWLSKNYVCPAVNRPLWKLACGQP